METEPALQNSGVDLPAADWQPAAGVERDFVRHRNTEKSPAMVRLHSPAAGPVRVSVVIPTSDADRGGYFAGLLAEISRQDFAGFEVIVVRGDPRQGRAINIGAALAKGEYLLTLDDDTSLPDRQTFRKLISLMDGHPDVGIAGGNNTVPANAGRFVQRVMRELPRRSWKPVLEITDSDLAEHPCMIMRTDRFKAIGGENELLPRGLDPYLREEFRNAGLRVVLAPDLVYHHLPPDNLKALLRQFFRNGRQAACVNRRYPQWVIETPSKHGEFKARKPFALRILRFPIRLLAALITLKPLFFLCETTYAAGFLCELLRTRITGQ